MQVIDTKRGNGNLNGAAVKRILEEVRDLLSTAVDKEITDLPEGIVAKERYSGLQVEFNEGVFWPKKKFDEFFKGKKKPPWSKRETIDGKDGFIIGSEYGVPDTCGKVKRMVNDGIRQKDLLFREDAASNTAEEVYDKAVELNRTTSTVSKRKCKEGEEAVSQIKIQKTKPSDEVLEEGAASISKNPLLRLWASKLMITTPEAKVKKPRLPMLGDASSCSSESSSALSITPLGTGEIQKAHKIAAECSVKLARILHPTVLYSTNLSATLPLISAKLKQKLTERHLGMYGDAEGGPAVLEKLTRLSNDCEYMEELTVGLDEFRQPNGDILKGMLDIHVALGVISSTPFDLPADDIISHGLGLVCDYHFGHNRFRHFFKCLQLHAESTSLSQPLVAIDNCADIVASDPNVLAEAGGVDDTELLEKTPTLAIFFAEPAKAAFQAKRLDMAIKTLLGRGNCDIQRTRTFFEATYALPEDFHLDKGTAGNYNTIRSVMLADRVPAADRERAVLEVVKDNFPYRHCFLAGTAAKRVSEAAEMTMQQDRRDKWQARITELEVPPEEFEEKGGVLVFLWSGV